MAYHSPPSPCVCLLVGTCVSSMHVCSLKGVTPRFSCRPGPEQADAGVGSGGGRSPPPSKEKKGLTVRAGISRKYTKQAPGSERRTFCKLPHPSLDHCSRLPCSPSFHRAPPIWAACLPQPEQSFQTINQIALLPTPLLPHLPIRSRREAKPGPSVLSAACRAGARERAIFCSLTHLLSSSSSSVSSLACSSI